MLSILSYLVLNLHLNSTQIESLQDFIKKSARNGKFEISIFKNKNTKDLIFSTGETKANGYANIYYKTIDRNGVRINFGKNGYKNKVFHEYSHKPKKPLPGYHVKNEQHALEKIIRK